MLYNIAVFFLRIFFRIFYQIEIHNEYEIPKNRIIVCPNHTSNFDPLLIACLFNRPVHYMAKKELFENPILSKIFKSVYAFPVDRDNPGLSTIKESIDILKNENILGVFIEGTRVEAFDLENANPGVGLLAVRAKSNVMPIKIDGTYKLFSKIDIYFREIIEVSNFNKNMHTYEDLSKMILLRIYDKDINYEDNLS